MRRPSTHPRNTFARDRGEIRWLLGGDGPLLGCCDDGGGQGVLAGPFDAGGMAKQIRFRHTGGGRTIAVTRGLPSGQRPRLVDDQGIDLFHALQALGGFDENAGARRPCRCRP